MTCCCRVSEQRRLVSWLDGEGKQRLDSTRTGAGLMTTLQCLVGLLECAGGLLNSLDLLLSQLRASLAPSSSTGECKMAENDAMAVCLPPPPPPLSTLLEDTGGTSCNL